MAANMTVGAEPEPDAYKPNPGTLVAVVAVVSRARPPPRA